MTQYVTVQLPLPTFERLQRTAQQQNRSIPDVVDALVAGIDRLPSLPDDVERELAALPNLSDDVLLALVHQPMPNDQQKELATLNDKAQVSNGLTPEERGRQAALGDIYQRAMLRRAHCLEILRQRGYELNQLLQMPTSPG